MNNDLIHVNTLPPFKRICMTIGELPTSYLETMTYYEMLVWFTEYMKNTVIPTVNNNAEAVEELQNKYIELKSYVDNYFDNLDVQEEINNKLDDMAESGELLDIITSYLQVNVSFVFNTLTEMKNSNNLVNGSYANTLGYHSINDDGGATYKIRTKLVTDIIDEGNIIELNNDLVGVLIYDDLINVKQFGAYGDNTHDDTLSIQTAINTEKDILIPEGTYLISSTINITNKNNYNFNAEMSTINYSGSDYAILFNTIRNSNIKLGTINAPSGSCISFEGSTSGQYTQYVNLDFTAFSCLNNCINVENTGSCWISEMRVNKGRFATGQNGFYILQNSSNGLSHWIFNEIGIEGVDVGFNLNVGSYATEQQHYIDSFEFNECRAGEADILFKNSGIVRKILWIGSHYVTPNQLQLTSEATWWKFIHAERTNYVYNGVFYDRSIDVTSNITAQNDIGFEGKVRMTDDLAILNIAIYGSNGEVALTQNKLLLSGLPKPKENIYFIAQNYGDNTQQQPRLYINTSGSLFAYWPGGAKLQVQNSPTYINLSYFKGEINL